MRILYIEDNFNDANLVSRYIRTTPHELVTVSSLEEAYAVFETKFDMVFIDLLLEEQRLGYTFAQDLRQSGYQQPLIAITALTTPGDMQACADVGFDGVLTKPYEITQLAELIQRFEKY